jgi:peptidoglycan/LPS O-acetylase OafA/YrhL
MHGGASITRLFVGLDTRADSLLIGCALAMVTTWRMLPRSTLAASGRRWAGATAAVGLCLLFATARYPADFRDGFASTLTAVAAGFLISELLTFGSPLARLFEFRPLVAVGRISYGLYLWHFPIFLGLGVLVSKTKTFDPARMALAWLITFAVCALSFRLLERPALRFKSSFRGAPARAGCSPGVFEEDSDPNPLQAHAPLLGPPTPASLVSRSG